MDKLTGSEQLAKALAIAQEDLTKLGYDKVDEQVLLNAIEQSYAQLKSAGTLDVYKDKEELKEEEAVNAK